MAVLPRFLAYAADFEKTLGDDDWSRLGQYFAQDAVYRVESSSMGCELEGPEAIFAGMKKSLDGFDRHFPTRDIATVGEPLVDGDEMRVAWTVTYHREGLPDFVLRGRSVVRMRGDEIVLLTDAYDEEMEREIADFARETGQELDPSYT